MGFQGLELKQPRGGSSVTPYTHPEACHALPGPKKSITEIFNIEGSLYLSVIYDRLHTTWYHKSHRLFKKLPNALILKFISHQINILVPTYVKLRLIIDR